MTSFEERVRLELKARVESRVAQWTDGRDRDLKDSMQEFVRDGWSVSDAAAFMMAMETFSPELSEAEGCKRISELRAKYRTREAEDPVTTLSEAELGEVRLRHAPACGSWCDICRLLLTLDVTRERLSKAQQSGPVRNDGYQDP